MTPTPDAAKAYSITEQQCREQINGVCSRCGGELVPIETVDNARNPTYWSGCTNCDVFDNGVSHRIHAIAKEMVMEHGHEAYASIRASKDDSEELRLYYEREQISGTCHTVSTVLKIQSLMAAAEQSERKDEQGETDG